MNDLCVQENAHFIVVDMVLEVLEGVKWTLSFNRRTTQQHTHCKVCTHRHTSPTDTQRCNTQQHIHACSAGDPAQVNSVTVSHRNTHSSYVHTHLCSQDEDEEEDAGNDEAEHQPKTFSVLSTDSGFEGKSIYLFIFTLHLDIIEY